MPIPPYAKVLASINGGAAQSGGLAGGFAQTVQLTPESTIGWFAAVWEIYDYPIGFSAPSGWSTAAGGVITFSPSNPTTPPPIFSLPASSNANWGKFAVRLRVNNNPLQYNQSGTPNVGFSSQLTDESTIIRLSSPNLGMHGVAFNESSQYDSLRQAVGEIMQCLRQIDGAGSPGGGFVPPTGSGLLHVTSSTLDPTAFLGTAAQIAIVNAGGTDVAWQTLSGAATISATGVLALATVLVPVGGTGRTSLTAHAVLIGEGTAAIGQVGPGAAGSVFQGAGASADPAFSTWTMAAPGTAGNVLTSDGTNWTSAPSSSGGIPAPGATITGNTTLTSGQTWVKFTGGTYTINLQNIVAGVLYRLTHVGPNRLEPDSGNVVTLSRGGASWVMELPNDRSQPTANSQVVTASYVTYNLVLDSTNNILTCVGVS